jgi:hypothetical protein
LNYYKINLQFIALPNYATKHQAEYIWV